MRYFLPALFLASALVFAPRLARADILPSDTCDGGSAGSPCNKAGPNVDEPGICVEATYVHHEPGGPDGGVISTPQQYLACELQDGGAADAGEDANVIIANGDAGPPPSQDAGPQHVDPGPLADSGKSGCSASPLGRGEATGVVMLALGIAALAGGRRRRSS